MKTLFEEIKTVQEQRIALGHFNISDLVALKAIVNAALRLASLAQGDTPIIIGVSEGEREFIGVKTISAIIHSLRKELNYPIFLNADHTRTMEGVKAAVEAEFDSVIFDGANLPFEENIAKTKEAVRYVKSKNKRILVEGELGYIGTSSEIFENIPSGAAVSNEQFTTPEQALRFVKETRVDLFAPAVGNVHGMMKNVPNPRLDIARIAEIKKAVEVPLVLHGGSGISDDDFTSAIQAGISMIHINTEIRVAWRQGIEQALQEQPNEVAPYKLLSQSLLNIQKIVEARLKLFSRSS